MKVSEVLKEWKANLLRGVPAIPLQSAVIVYKLQLRNYPDLPPMIGWYKRIMASGGTSGDHLYGYFPIFGHRKMGIVAARRDMDQVRVMCYGELDWRNVDENDYHIMSEAVVSDTRKYTNNEG